MGTGGQDYFLTDTLVGSHTGRVIGRARSTFFISDLYRCVRGNHTQFLLDSRLVPG